MTLETLEDILTRAQLLLNNGFKPTLVANWIIVKVTLWEKENEPENTKS